MPTQQRKAGDKTPGDQVPARVEEGQSAGQPAPVQMMTETPGLGRTDEAGGLASLEARVTRLENMTGNRLNPAGDRTQDEVDEEILSRVPNSHAEAVAYQAALDRRELREGERKNEDEG